MHLRALMPSLRALSLHSCNRSHIILQPRLDTSRACSARSLPSSVVSWLQGLEQYQARPGSNLCSGILERAEQLEAEVCSPLYCVNGASASPRGFSTMSSHSSSFNMPSSLVEQKIHMPNSYAVPHYTTVPAYQLVGIFRAMLGQPALPHAARASSLEAKWALLQLLLLYAAGEQQQYEEKLQHLLDQVLLQHAANKVAQVLVNPKVPLVNKQAAEQRHQQLYDTCLTSITTWVSRTCQSDKFKLLQPAMSGIANAMDSSVVAGSHQPVNDTSTSGRMMEEAALEVLQASLPPGWSVIPSVHLLGANDEAFTVEQGCKYEVDMLVLDDTGYVVAVVEVKLAAANPLMSLFNDVNALLNIVDRVSGSTVTGITKSDLPDAAAASTAAVLVEGVSCSSNGSGYSALAKAREATLVPPFAERVWKEVHLIVREQVAAVYLLGNQIADADVLRGLASLVDSSALKLMAKSADVTAAALAGNPSQELQQEGSTRQLDQQQQQQPPGVSMVSEQLAEGLPVLTRTSSSGSSSSTSSSNSNRSSCSNRVRVNLTSEMQETIAKQIQARMSVLQRCKIYSLCRSVPLQDAAVEVTQGI